MLQISKAASTFPSLRTQDKITWNFLILLLNIWQTITPSRVRQGGPWLFFMERSQDNIKPDQPIRKMAFHLVCTYPPWHTIYHVITLVTKSKEKNSHLYFLMGAAHPRTAKHHQQHPGLVPQAGTEHGKQILISIAAAQSKWWKATMWLEGETVFPSNKPWQPVLRHG